jgi:hypothetical protein
MVCTVGPGEDVLPLVVHNDLTRLPRHHGSRDGEEEEVKRR